MHIHEHMNFDYKTKMQILVEDSTKSLQGSYSANLLCRCGVGDDGNEKEQYTIALKKMNAN